MDVILRALQPGDRPQIAFLLRATEVFREDEVNVALELVDAVLDRPDHPDYRFSVAAAGDEVAGYACWGPTPCTLGTFDLYWIAAFPAYQGKGVGRRLLAHAEADMASRGARMCVIETSSLPRYSAARDFYIRMGYREEARLREFYAPGDDKIIFVRHISGSGNRRDPPLLPTPGAL